MFSSSLIFSINFLTSSVILLVQIIILFSWYFSLISNSIFNFFLLFPLGYFYCNIFLINFYIFLISGYFFIILGKLTMIKEHKNEVDPNYQTLKFNKESPLHSCALQALLFIRHFLYLIFHFVYSYICFFISCTNIMYSFSIWIIC